MAKGLHRDWKTKTIVLHSPELMDEAESITIRGFYSDDTRQKILAASIEQIRHEDGTVATRATLDRLRATKRELAVVSWVLKYEDGGNIPFEKETLLNLPTELADWLDDEISKAWDNLGTPIASKEEAERLETERKADALTFQRADTPVAQGRASGPVADDGARAGDTGSSGAGAETKASLGKIRG